MKERSPVRQPPNLILASERNPGKGRDVFLTCLLLDEIQIRRKRTATSYRVVPQMFMFKNSLKVALSLVEDDNPVASKTQQIQTDVDYRIEYEPIKISFAKKSDEKVVVKIKAHGYYIVKPQFRDR